MLGTKSTNGRVMQPLPSKSKKMERGEMASVFVMEGRIQDTYL